MTATLNPKRATTSEKIIPTKRDRARTLSNTIDTEPDISGEVLTDKLLSFYLLGGNWDGQGAVKPSPNALRLAIGIVEMLRKHPAAFQKLGVKCILPTDLQLDSDGTIVFGWDTQNHLFELEIHNDESISFSDIDRIKQTSVTTKTIDWVATAREDI